MPGEPVSPLLFQWKVRNALDQLSAVPVKSSVSKFHLYLKLHGVDGRGNIKLSRKGAMKGRDAATAYAAPAHARRSQPRIWDAAANNLQAPELHWLRGYLFRNGSQQFSRVPGTYGMETLRRASIAESSLAILGPRRADGYSEEKWREHRMGNLHGMFFRLIDAAGSRRDGGFRRREMQSE